MNDVYINEICSYVPEGRLPNSFFEVILETTSKWIEEGTGILERRYLKNYTGSYPGFELARRALNKAHPSFLEGVDWIISASGVDDIQYPTLANMVSREFNLNVPSMHLKGACTSAAYALFTAQALLQTGQMDKILLVVSEAATRIQDYSDRKSCILWGDGATVLTLSKRPVGLKIKSISLGGEGSHLIHTGTPGQVAERSIQDIVGAPDGHGYGVFGQEGRKVFKQMARKIPREVNAFLKKQNLGVSDLDYLILHQANLVLQEVICHNLGLPNEKHLYTVDKYGNTGASGCVISLAEAYNEGKLKKGDTVLMSPFGAGILWGNCLLEIC